MAVVTVHTPVDMSRLFDSYGYLTMSALKQLPITMAAESLLSLFRAFFERHQPGAFTDVSKIQGLPHFTIIRLVIWQVSNQRIGLPELDRLIDKIDDLNCWEPLCAILALQNLSVMATCETLIPLLYFRNNPDIARTIHRAQPNLKTSRYSFIVKGVDLVNANLYRQVREADVYDGDMGSQKYNTYTFHKSLFTDVMWHNDQPSSPRQAYIGLRKCIEASLSRRSIVESWGATPLIAKDIERVAAGFLKGDNSAWRPLLHDGAEDAQCLVHWGFRMNLYFRLLSALIADDIATARVLMEYCDMPDSLRLTGLESLAEDTRSSRMEMLLENGVLDSILRRAVDEVQKHLFVGSDTFRRNRHTQEVQVVLRTPINRASLLLYYLACGHHHPISTLEQLYHASLSQVWGVEDLKSIFEKSRLILTNFMGDIENSEAFIQDAVGLVLDACACVGVPDRMPGAATELLWAYLISLRVDYNDDRYPHVLTSSLRYQPHMPTITALLDAGADIDARNPFSTQLNFKDDYAINISLLADDPSFCCSLLARGIDLSKLRMEFEREHLCFYRLNPRFSEALKRRNELAVKKDWSERARKAGGLATFFVPGITDELEGAMVSKDRKLCQELAIKGLSEFPHPLITILNWRPATSHLQQQDIFELLDYVFDHTLNLEGRDIAEVVSPSYIKRLHWDVCLKAFQTQNTEALERFLDYGERADGLQFDDEHRPYGGAAQHAYTTFRNIPHIVIQRDGGNLLTSVRSLVGAGYNVNEKAVSEPNDPSGMTLLIAAIHSSNVNLFTYLLERGASIYQSGRGGYAASAVEIAVDLGRLDMVALLLQFDPLCKKMALSRAVEQDRYTIAEMIRDWKVNEMDEVDAMNVDLSI